MIFVTLGTHEQPFPRILDLLAGLSDSEGILVQHGTTPIKPDLQNVQWVTYLDWDVLVDTMRSATVVVCHAGVGSAMTAMESGKTPVLVPRLARLREHVDDHQLQLAERLAARGLALICRPGESLADLVVEARNSKPQASDVRGGGLSRVLAEVALGRRPTRSVESG